LKRTFGEHPTLSTPAGQASLRRVLLAYAARNEHLGYCQVTMMMLVLLLLVFLSAMSCCAPLTSTLGHVMLRSSYA